MQQFPAIPDTITVTDFQRKAADVLKRLEKEDGIKVIMSHNKAQGVLMSTSVYKQVQEEAEIKRIVAEGEIDLLSGKTVKATSLSKAMKKAKELGVV